MTFAIITDSASDIEPEFEIKENIFIVPTIIIFDKEEFRDTEINRNEFLNRIKSGDIATTSQPSPADIDDKYREALKTSEGQEILGIHFEERCGYESIYYDWS